MVHAAQPERFVNQIPYPPMQTKTEDVNRVICLENCLKLIERFRYPWNLLKRCWRAWSTAPPERQALLGWVGIVIRLTSISANNKVPITYQLDVFFIAAKALR